MSAKPSLRNGLPDDIRNLPLEIQVAVLYERVGYLANDVKTMKTGFWALVLALLTASITIAAYALGGR